MNFVSIDLGASNTRYSSNDGKINILPNSIAFIKDVNRNVALEITDNTPENNLDVVIYKENDNTNWFPMRGLVGALAARYDGISETPSLLKNKIDQPINYFSAILSVAMTKYYNENFGDVVNLFVTLPPIEVTSRKEVFKNNIIGKYKVVLSRLNKTFEFTIANVACYEESRMAIVRFLTNRSKSQEERAKYMSGNILSIDIGASTTDLAIFQRGRYLEGTGRTYKIGGNLARDYIINEMASAYNAEIPYEEAEQYLAEGRARFGNVYRDISGIIDNAKSAVARAVIKQMDSYFSSMNIPIQTINYIVVSGGGSMGSSYIDENKVKHNTSEPMSKYITDALSDVCDGIEVIYFGDEPRLANISGLTAYAMAANGEINN